MITAYADRHVGSSVMVHTGQPLQNPFNPVDYSESSCGQPEKIKIPLDAENKKTNKQKTQRQETNEATEWI